MRDLLEYGQAQDGRLQALDLEVDLAAARALSEYMWKEITQLQKVLSKMNLDRYTPNMNTLYENAGQAITTQEEDEIRDGINVRADDLFEEDAWSDEEREEAFAIVYQMRMNARVLAELMQHSVVRRTAYAQVEVLRKRTLSMKRSRALTDLDEPMQAL